MMGQIGRHDPDLPDESDLVEPRRAVWLPRKPRESVKRIGEANQ